MDNLLLFATKVSNSLILSLSNYFLTCISEGTKENTSHLIGTNHTFTHGIPWTPRNTINYCRICISLSNTYLKGQNGQIRRSWGLINHARTHFFRRKVQFPAALLRTIPHEYRFVSIFVRARATHHCRDLSHTLRCNWQQDVAQFFRPVCRRKTPSAGRLISAFWNKTEILVMVSSTIQLFLPMTINAYAMRYSSGNKFPGLY